jgi:hypothetical protein
MILVRVELRLGLVGRPRRQPLDVGHGELLAGRVEGDGSRIPADRHEPEELRLPLLVRLPFEHRDGVLGGVAAVEPLAVR